MSQDPSDGEVLDDDAVITGSVGVRGGADTAEAADASETSAPVRRNPFAPAPPPPGAMSFDGGSEFGDNSLAAAAAAFAAMAPPRIGSGSSSSASTAPAPVKPAAAPSTEPPPLERRPPAETRPRVASARVPAAPQPPPLERKTAPSVPAASAPSAPSTAPASATPSPSAATASSGVQECRVVESKDGIKVLWDVLLPGGGGAVVILTPRRGVQQGSDSRGLPAHVSWRGADAVAATDVESFAQVLIKAARAAEGLPPALLS